jgi:chromosome segregation ATPase
MVNEIQHHRNGTVMASDDEIVSPVSSWTLFWRPRYQGTPRCLINIPFLFWLTYTLQPRVVITIGDSDGTTHFALCQAVEKLDLDTRCLGMGPWGASDCHEIPDTLQAYNHQTYPDLSRLSAQNPAAAIRRLPKGSIDILYVALDCGLDRKDLAQWLMDTGPDRIAASGVLILGNVNAELDRPEADPLIEQLMNRYPHFHLENGDGLLLFAVGNTPHDRVRRLCGLTIGTNGYSALTQLFARIGRGLKFEAQARSDGKLLAELQEEFEATSARLARADEDNRKLSATYDELKRSYAERHQATAEMQARMVDFQLEARQAKADTALLAKEMADTNHNLAQANARLGELESALNDAENKNAETLRVLESTSKKEKRLRKEREHLEQVQAEARTQLTQSEAALLTAKAEVEEQRNALVQAQALASEQSDALQAEHRKALDVLTRDLNEARTQLTQSEADLLTAKAEVEEQRNALVQAQALASEQSDALQAEHRKALDVLTRDLNEARTQLTQSEAASAQKQSAHLHALEVIMRDAETMVSERDATIRTLQDQVRRMEAERITQAEADDITAGILGPLLPAATDLDRSVREAVSMKGDLGSSLAALAEAFERQQIANDMTAENLRRERSALETMLRNNAFDPAPVLEELRTAQSAAPGRSREQLEQRMRQQISALEALRQSLRSES